MRLKFHDLFLVGVILYVAVAAIAYFPMDMGGWIFAIRNGVFFISTVSLISVAAFFPEEFTTLLKFIAEVVVISFFLTILVSIFF